MGDEGGCKGSCFRKRSGSLTDPGGGSIAWRRASRLAVRTEDASTTTTTSSLVLPDPRAALRSSRTEEGGQAEWQAANAVSRIQPS
jgi:hypothetical protein